MVEGAALERQGERIRLSKLYPVCEPAPSGEDACRFDASWGSVDRRHPETASGRSKGTSLTDVEAVVQRYYRDRSVVRRIDEALRSAGI